MKNEPKNSNENKFDSQFWLSLFEIVVYIFIAIYFYSPYNKPDIGIIVWFTGSALVLNRCISNNFYRESCKTTEGIIKRIEEVIDLRNKTNINIISQILDSYLNITEPEFNIFKEEIVITTLSKLDQLKTQKRSEELTSTEYIDWLLTTIKDVKNGDYIRAVSVVEQWKDEPQWHKYAEYNLAVAKKGAIVERIFVIDAKLLNETLNIDIVKKHTIEQENETKLKGYYVDKNKLKEETKLSSFINKGYFMVNSKVAIIDYWDPHGSPKTVGYVTMNDDEIKRMQQNFKEIMNISTRLSFSSGNANLSAKNLDTP